ncbi:MAG: LysM peptidoglycan-binding domain-containing protein [Gammaproteobacteria bacterium]|nr:LysM peptidoglycan-binding domain-containing protein [Gammaproteobacteria bacterium]
MDNNKHAPIRNGLLAFLLSVMAGCATTHQSSLESTDTSLRHEILALPSENSDDASEAGDLYAESESGEWNEINGAVFPPDPEHQTLETSPAQAGRGAEDPDREAGDAGQQMAEHTDAPDLWERVRSGYGIPRHDNPRVRAELEWYVRHPDYLDRTIDRSRPYLYVVVENLKERGMPMEIALLPIVESAYQPFAYSHGRAAGIWQFIPSTAQHYGLKLNWWYDGRRDILASTRAALDYLQSLHDELDNDWLLALAAYNSGAGTVKRAVRANQRHGKPTDFWSLQLPAETRAYVPKLLALAELFANPDAQMIKIPSVPDMPVVRTVQTGAQIDLAKAAELADTSLDEIYRLNPAFNRWATDPDGPHQLLLPLDKAELFETRIATLGDADRLTWQRYVIRTGDTLGGIADRHHTTVDALRRVNNIKGNMIRAGNALLIPISTRSLSGYALSQDERTRAAQNSPRSGKKLVYAVRGGDTLWDIARAHGVAVAHLASWNGISPRDPLRIGQRLVIWQTRQANADATAGPNAQHPLSNTTRRINYTVRKGDSLAGISHRFNVKVTELRNWNSLRKNEYLHPGQKLTLYVDVINQTENI